MWLYFCLAAIVVVLYPTLPYFKIALQSIDTEVCPLYPSLAPPSFYKDNSTVLKILNDEAWKNASAARLSGAVQVDTQIQDNQPDVDVAPELWEQFGPFHEYLEKTFPKMHLVPKVYKVNTWGLVYHWEGSNAALKPLMLAAHQDVVPVQKDTLKDWSYPPFEGHYDGEYLYGRGASDCKNLLIAVMEALETLLEEGYKPQRGVIVAFGFDEEASGRVGAAAIGKFLEEKYGFGSMYAIVDEGMGLAMDPLINQVVATPGTGEKGYTDLQVKLAMRGGHSSIPPDHGAVGIMGELAYNIEQDQYLPLLTEQNPTLHYLQCLALHSTAMPKMQRKAIMRAGFDKLANSKVIKVLGQNPMTKYMVQTAQAIDILRGGEKANALPEEVSLVVNHRIAVGTPASQIATHFVDRVVALAEKYGMDVEAYGETVRSVAEPNGKFTVSVFDETLEYAPITPRNDKVWEYLAGSTRHVFEDLVLDLDYPLIMAPGMMPANSDTRRYWNLTKHIFHYSPMVFRGSFTENNIHSVNEKILINNHLELTAFYYEYVQTVDTPDADN